MKKSRVDEITEEIQELIFSNEFSDGTRLDEISLAEKFGVSRTPLREALRNLALSGLVEQIPRRGVFVRQPGPVELLEMFELMSELEALCGKLAAARISDDALRQLVDANNQCKTAMNASRHDEYYDKNEHFHQIIYRQSGNSFLESETLKLQTRLRPYRRIQLRFRGRVKQSHAEHERIIEALTNNDPVAAETELRGHVSVQGDRFYQLIASFKEVV